VPLPLYRADDEHLSLRGAAMFAIVAAGELPGETPEGGAPAGGAGDERLRQLGEMVAARATPVAVEAPLRETYGRLYRRWLAWMESILPPGETRQGSTDDAGKGGYQG
jgi:hypothetical protein